MKKSASVSLTVVAAFGIAAQAQPRVDPCGAANFNEQACQAAVQNRGYCSNGQWVKLKYHNAYPYYYNAHQAYVTNGGVVSAAVVGTCGPPSGSHGVGRGGFGAIGADTAVHG